MGKMAKLVVEILDGDMVGPWSNKYGHGISICMYAVAMCCVSPDPPGSLELPLSLKQVWDK